MPDTLSAPADRATAEVLAEEEAAFRSLTAFSAGLDAMPLLVMVLNAERQVVIANRCLYTTLGTTPAEVIGRRPGELIRCLGVVEGPGGCGTAERCRLCGAVNAVRRSMDSGQQVQEECRLQLQDHCRVMDLEAVATPFTTAGRTYTIVSLRDIAGDKRREMLERLFFHDVINTAGGLHGLARSMLDLGPSADDLRILVQVSDQLMEELHNQRDLIAAERGKLLPDPQPVRLDALLTGLRDLYARHTVARGRTVQLLSAPAMTATTDTVLLRRAVGNLVKNALEASQRDEAVTMTLHADGDAAVITVHNPAVMNDDIKLQVFQRSFSTKGAGRGLGTYSARLLVERCLGGSLVLVSEEGRGTTVTVRVPLRFPSSLPRR